MTMMGNIKVPTHPAHHATSLSIDHLFLAANNGHHNRIRVLIPLTLPHLWLMSVDRSSL